MLWDINILKKKYKKDFSILKVIIIIFFNKFLKYYYLFMLNKLIRQ